MGVLLFVQQYIGIFISFLMFQHDLLVKLTPLYLKDYEFLIAEIQKPLPLITSINGNWRMMSPLKCLQTKTSSLSSQCGEEGHMSRACPKKEESGDDFFGGSSFGGGGDGGSSRGRGGNCYKVRWNQD